MIQQCSLGKGIVAFYAIHSYELVAVAGRFVVCRKPDSRGRDRSWSKYPRNEQDLLRAHKVTARLFSCEQARARPYSEGSGVEGRFQALTDKRASSLSLAEQLT